jgi:hypothetical protein
MKRFLWILLPPVLVVVARMHVEWVWFAQFNWQSVLFQRWMLQLLFAWGRLHTSCSCGALASSL